MAKRRAGLHKEITSIFDGVPIPKDNGTPPPQPSAPAPERAGHKEQPIPNKWRLEETSVPQKPSAPVAKTAPPPKHQRPAEPQPEPVPTKQPKANTAIKTGKQNPLQKVWEQIEKKFFAPKPGVSATRQKVMAILIPVLFLALIFVFVRVFGTAPRRVKGAEKNNAAKTTAGTNKKIDWQIPEPYPTTLRDPMQFGSAGTTQAGGGQLTVTGILYTGDNPSASSASIGNQIVHEGEKILGATIVKINKDSVEFEMNGKTWTQKVQEQKGV